MTSFDLDKYFKNEVFDEIMIEPKPGISSTESFDEKLSFYADDEGDDYIKNVNLAQLYNTYQYENNIKLLNAEQKSIFDMVQKHIEVSLQRKTESLRVFITGGAGTGKTFLLKMIQQLIVRMYHCARAVRIGAFTGAAAKLIEGKTLHSLFRIPINNSSSKKKEDHEENDYSKDWRLTQFLVIDEISMVSYEMFHQIHTKLQYLLDNKTELFGGMNVIVFGDLFQLNPIKGSLIYHQRRQLRSWNKIFLWRMFKFIELKANMRQKGDQDFISLLNNARFGRLTARDVKLLYSRLRNAEGVDEFDRTNKESIRVVPTNLEARTYNNKKLAELVEETGVTVHQIEAIDVILKPQDVIIRQPFIIPDNEFLTGGFPKFVKLAEGAKVMLRFNMNVDIGLVNGSIGTIKSINYPKNNEDQDEKSFPNSVLVDFGTTGTHLIIPKTIDFESPQRLVQVQRTQIPLILAWAVTSHKLQGATIDTAVISLGYRTFAAGQPYVMLSRCRSLQGLIFNELQVHKIKRLVNRHAMKEIKRLRKNT